MTNEEAIKNLKKLKSFHNGSYGTAINHAIKALEQTELNPSYNSVKTELEPCEDMGEVSDGYHTFNQLYHQRAVLFATIVNQNKDKSWKSFKHSDGSYCFDSNGEWFIVGIDTPQGSYTYHYAKEYWDMFDCQELECGKEWDGHTEEDVTRLLSLQQQSCDDAISRDAVEKITWEEPNYDDVLNVLTEVRDKVRALPSVTPQQTCEEENPNCTECRYYDKEKHHCPRFCHVIEDTMAEITSDQTKWIPVSEKPQEGTYLITGQYGKYRYVDISTFDGEDATDIMSWDSYSDEYKMNKREHKVIAYMPLPEPYKESDG